MRATATHVMILRVYGVEVAFAIVREFAGSVAGMTFGNRAPKMKITTIAMATVVAAKAQPSERLAVRITVATSAAAAMRTGIHVHRWEEYAACAQIAHTPATTRVGTASRAARVAERSRSSPGVCSARKSAPGARHRGATT